MPMILEWKYKDSHRFVFKIVVNCAGAHMHAVAVLMGYMYLL